MFHFSESRDDKTEKEGGDENGEKDNEDNEKKQEKAIIKKKANADDEDGETGPNTYDYNDSFINDETQKTENAEEDSEEEVEEDEEEDISELKKEAKQFIRNEKMTKAWSVLSQRTWT